MKDDTREELERIEKELLAQEDFPSFDHSALTDNKDELDAILQEFSVPAFDDPMDIHDPEGPMVYRNYNNDYGGDLQEFSDTAKNEPKKKTDKVVVGLMIAVCCLCLGIISVLAYWLNVFFK